MDTQFIGHSGENLLKQRLLEKGINVAVPEIDNGIDVLAETPTGEWITIQVKTSQHVSYAGYGKDKHRPVLTWSFPKNLVAAYLALVNLETAKIFLYPREEAFRLAQQSSGKSYRLYFDIGSFRSKKINLRPESHEPFALENWLFLD